MIYGFHVDGSECHSQHCALKHVPLNEGMDTRPSAELTAELTAEVKERLQAVSDRMSKMEREGLITRRKPWEKVPEIKFPPAPYSPEWWEQLSPEQRARLQETHTQVMARLVTALQPFVQLFQTMAPVLNELGRAVQPFLTAMQRVRDEQEHGGKNEQEPCDTCSGMGCAECEPIAPNAGSAT